MTLQTAVNFYNAAGLVGDQAFSGPVRSTPYNLVSSPNPNVIGFAFTVSAGANPDPSAAAPNAGNAVVGGTGIFAGILWNSKEQVGYGTTGNPLGASMVLPDYKVGELMTMGEVWVNLKNSSASVGDLLVYDTAGSTPGALSSIPATTTGFTVTQSTTTLTVAGAPANSALGVGSVVTITGALQSRILALGTGTGGNGTYTVDTSQTVAGGTAATATSVPQSGTARVPNGVISHYDITAAGLAVAKLTN